MHVVYPTKNVAHGRQTRVEQWTKSPQIEFPKRICNFCNDWNFLHCATPKGSESLRLSWLWFSRKKGFSRVCGSDMLGHVVVVAFICALCFTTSQFSVSAFVCLIYLHTLLLFLLLKKMTWTHRPKELWVKESQEWSSKNLKIGSCFDLTNDKLGFGPRRGQSVECVLCPTKAHSGGKNVDL